MKTLFQKAKALFKSNRWNNNVPCSQNVVVVVDGKRYEMFNNYAYYLTCSKSGGWQFWNKWMGQETRIGGEDSDEFKVLIGDTVLVNNQINL